MSIDIVALLVAGGVAFISWWLAFHQEKSPRRKAAMVMSIVLTAIGGLMLVEVAYRKSQLDPMPQQFDREWTAAQNATISAIEIETIAPDGLYDPPLLEISKGVSVEISGVDFIAPAPGQSPDRIDFSDVFSPERIETGARLGHVVANVHARAEGGAKTIDRFDDINCVSSVSFGERLSHDAFRKSLNSLCSVAVRVSPGRPDLTLGDLTASKSITMTVTMPDKVSCVGICRSPLIFSVKAILKTGNGLFPMMIELSPEVLRRYAPSASAGERSLTYTLSGSQLADIAKSNFIQTYGYHDPGHFALTMGLIDTIYRRLTTRTETWTLLSVVWALKPDTEEKFLLDAIPSASRPTAEVFSGPEWCGFGDPVADRSGDPHPPICWNRFLIMGKPSRQGGE